MNKFITKHKRLLIIVLIALIIIGVAYYFTLGKDLFQPRPDQTGSDSSSESNSNPSSSSNLNPNDKRTSDKSDLGPLSGSSFPLKWGVKSAKTTLLQQRLNHSITTCKKGSTISEDGILGNETVQAIKSFFPNIGNSVAANRQITELEYNNIIQSKPGC